MWRNNSNRSRSGQQQTIWTRNFEESLKIPPFKVILILGVNILGGTGSEDWTKYSQVKESKYESNEQWRYKMK